MAPMEIVHGIYSLKPRHRGCVLTVGNFDGVHLGHRHLLEHLFERARALEAPSMLLTFELAGVFDRIAALVVGGMTAMRDNTTAFGFSVDNPFGRTVDGILRERIGQRALPVVTGVRAGHLDDNLPLVLGTTVHIA